MRDDAALQKAILDNIPDQAWLKDADSHYILVNEAFMAACRLPESMILGRLPVDVWPCDWGEKYMDTDRRVMKGGQRLRYEEKRRGADGELHWYDTIKTPIFDQYGHVVGTIGISRDITERHQSEQALLASRGQLRELSAHLQSVREKERTRIARELHDELGQLATALRIGFDVLEKRCAVAQADWLADLSPLKQLADSMMLSVQRIAADLRPAILDELGLLCAIEWLLESCTERTGIRHTLLLPPALPAIDTETGTAIFRIVQEALTNLCRHSGADRVSVELIVSMQEITLTITDNGKGMVEKETSSKGLGLLGMRERAVMLGGSLDIQSRHGVGTCIVLRLPVVRTGQEAS